MIDSASQDEGIALLKGYNVHVLSAPKGYAQALAVGYQHAYNEGWGSLVQLDGDGQHHPMYARGLHNMLSQADWVIGSRHETGSLGNVGIRFSSWLSRKVLLPSTLHDPSSGYWALNARMIERFAELFPVEFTELPLRISQLDSARICEYCVPMKGREEGESMNAGWKGIQHGIRMIVHGWLMQKN